MAGDALAEGIDVQLHHLFCHLSVTIADGIENHLVLFLKVGVMFCGERDKPKTQRSLIEPFQQIDEFIISCGVGEA